MAAAVPLGRLLRTGQRQQGECGVGREMQRELQENEPETQGNGVAGGRDGLAGEKLAQAVEQLGHALRRRGDEQGSAGARFDLGQQCPRVGVPLAFDALEVSAEDALRQLGLAGAGGVTGIGERDAQDALVVLRDSAVGAPAPPMCGLRGRPAGRGDSGRRCRPNPAASARRGRPAPRRSCPAPGVSRPAPGRSSAPRSGACRRP